MINRICGVLFAKQPPTIIVDVNGIGYEIDVPMTTFYQLPSIGEKVILMTHFVVREDAHQLYGFLAETDRQLFRDLLKVNGIGARTALSILSGLEGSNLVAAIVNGEIATLIKIPGIGRKTAERLVLELKDRLSRNEMLITLSEEGSVVNDAMSALVALGYNSRDAEKIVKKHKDSAGTSEELIRLALKEMVR